MSAAPVGVAVGMEFAYSNLADRRPGPLLIAARRVVPGFGKIGRQVGAYAAAWQESNLLALERSGPLWVVLGDSLSQGIGASSVEKGWVPLAAAALRDEGVDLRVVNLSVSGARTDELIDHQLPVLAALPEPAVVTVMIGSNDMVRRRYREALPAQFARLLGLVPPGSLVATMPDVNRGIAVELNAVAARAATERGIIGVPYAGGQRMRAEDHFHPNDEGYRAMAEPYVAAIAEALRNRVTTGG